MFDLSIVTMSMSQSTALVAIMIGYDSIEGSLSRLKLFICVSAMMQPVGDLMRSNLGWPQTTL